MSNYHVPIHADSARDRPLEEPKPGPIVSPSYLPGYVVVTVEASPPRTIVVNAEKLVEAVSKIAGESHRVVHLTGVQS